MIFLEILLLIVGMVLLIKGADWFVDGSSKIAKAMHIPTLIIGLTLVSMGTSAPELAVSITSGIAGKNDMSLGNVVGSNSFNTFLILGISSVLIPLIIGKDMKKYDIPIMLGIYALLLIFGFLISPNKLDRIESIILLVLFIGYMVFLVLRTKKENKNKEDIEEEPEEKVTKKQVILSILFVILGLAAIIGGSELVVNNASKLAGRLGMSEALVGLTVVAIGTSLPELVTSIVAAIKKENDIAVGNVIGSNIFNALLILGTTSVIKPLTLSNESLFDLGVLFVSGLLIFIISIFSKEIKKWQGVIFIVLYVLYIAYIILRNYGIV